MNRIADYELVRELGEGNNGTFWLAVRPPRLSGDDEHVTVKILDATGDDATFRRMVRELRAFAAVPSPFLVPLLDAGQVGPRFYYAMPWHPLGSLETPAAPLEPSAVRRAVADAARATHALHEAGIAHRDIRPGNVWLTETGGRLADLGLSQVLGPGATVTGLGNLESAEYLDPAILRGEPASRATDIWALGLTLHTGLTGESAHPGLPARDPLLAVRRILNHRPTLSDRLKPDEREIVEACLASDPVDRPHTALEVATRLDAIA